MARQVSKGSGAIFQDNHSELLEEARGLCGIEAEFLALNGNKEHNDSLD